MRGPGIHLFTGAHGVKWVFIQKLSRGHALELTALVIANHSPLLTTDIMKVQKFAATDPTGIELQRLVLTYGDKFTFASGYLHHETVPFESICCSA